jgi:hypothetical protein
MRPTSLEHRVLVGEFGGRWLLLAALTCAGAAAAGDVYINDVNVEGLTNQSFEKVNVRLDEKGNVHIDAPGYSVKRVTLAETKPPAPDAVISRKYFLVTEQTAQGQTEYDIDVFLNGKFLRTLSSADPQLVSELSKTLKPGRNQVLLQARKHLETRDAPKSTSKASLFRVIIGEGSVHGEQVVIEKQLVTYVRTAADSADETQEFSFTTR